MTLSGGMQSRGGSINRRRDPAGRRCVGPKEGVGHAFGDGGLDHHYDSTRRRERWLGAPEG